MWKHNSIGIEYIPSLLVQSNKRGIREIKMKRITQQGSLRSKALTCSKKSTYRRKQHTQLGTGSKRYAAVEMLFQQWCFQETHWQARTNDTFQPIFFPKLRVMWILQSWTWSWELSEEQWGISLMQCLAENLEWKTLPLSCNRTFQHQAA